MQADRRNKARGDEGDREKDGHERQQIRNEARFQLCSGQEQLRQARQLQARGKVARLGQMEQLLGNGGCVAGSDDAAARNGFQPAHRAPPKWQLDRQLSENWGGDAVRGNGAGEHEGKCSENGILGARRLRGVRRF